MFSIMSQGSWVRAINRGGEIIGLRDQGYWEQILKESHNDVFFPQSPLLDAFPCILFLVSSGQTSMVQIISIFQGNQGSERTMPKITESATGRAWISHQINLTTNSLTVLHIRSTATVSWKSHTEYPSSCLCYTAAFFLLCYWILAKLLLMMSASST